MYLTYFFTGVLVAEGDFRIQKSKSKLFSLFSQFQSTAAGFSISNMNWRSEHIWVELLKGSRKRGNFFWACILFLGSLGFLSVGISSYLGKNIISILPSQEILFFPQGVVMSFYGIAGLFISSYLWCTILWNVGSGYDRFDRKEGIVCIFRWGFPGIKRRVFLRFLMRDIQSIRIQVKEGLYPRRILYMEIRGQGIIPLTRTDDKFFTPREIEQKAAELAYFLRVPIEVF